MTELLGAPGREGEGGGVRPGQTRHPAVRPDSGGPWKGAGLPTHGSCDREQGGA